MALVNGRLEARLSASPNSIYLTSTKRYNDGLRHYVTLLKIDDRYGFVTEMCRVQVDIYHYRYSLYGNVV